MTDHLTFLKQRLGNNYVLVHRRSAQPRYDRAGHLQQQVLPREHTAAEREYRALYGDPYDAPRRQMYLALLAARPLVTDAAVAAQIDAAIAAGVDNTR